MDRIEGRTALVTGAAGGIGLAIATELLRAGARVVLADIDKAELDQVVGPLGANAASFVLDVTDRAQWAEAKRFTEQRFGPVEILACNAGVAPDGKGLADMDPASFERVIRINLLGVFNGVSAFAAEMRGRRDGHIVMTASTAGLMPTPMAGGYTASKFGVVGLAETLRIELAPDNIGVSVLCPGLTRTRMTRPPPDMEEGPMRSALSTALDPAIVGELVLAGIRANRCHILTHGEHRRLISRRTERILSDIADLPERGGVELGHRAD